MQDTPTASDDDMTTIAGIVRSTKIALLTTVTRDGYLSLAGTAELVHDRVEIDRRWSAAVVEH